MATRPVSARKPPAFSLPPGSRAYSVISHAAAALGLPPDPPAPPDGPALPAPAAAPTCASACHWACSMARPALSGYDWLLSGLESCEPSGNGGRWPSPAGTHTADGGNGNTRTICPRRRGLPHAGDSLDTETTAA